MNNELHLIILLIVKYVPVKTPCFFKAVIPYSEQVGEYLQLLPINGEIKSLYILIRKINGNARSLLIFII